MRNSFIMPKKSSASRRLLLQGKAAGVIPSSNCSRGFPCAPDDTRKAPAGILFFSALFLCLFLQVHLAAAGPRPSTSGRIIGVNEDVIRGIDLLYDLEFDTAEEHFLRVVAARPDHPIGYFYLAMVSWSKLSTGFWSPDVVQDYVNRIDRTIAVARKSIERGSPDSFSYFYLGGALGFKGRFELMQYNWLSAANLAWEAIHALKTCLEMDPGNKDVLFGLGMYDYYTARLSGVLKLLTYLLLHKGDRDEGLRKLHIAANEAVYSAVESKSMLAHIYMYMEEEYLKALPFVQDLASRFKNNSRYKFFEGVIYSRLHLKAKFDGTLDFMRQRSREETRPEKAAQWARQALYLEASDFLFCQNYRLARLKLDAILSQPDPVNDPWMIAWPLLKKGMSYDLEGNRQKALEFYNQVNAMENGAGAQFLARKCIDSPPKKGDPFLGF
jgi:tetratricopeptide (TPR) repeat protein